MNRALTVSEPLYERLEIAVRVCGLRGIEQLIEVWHSSEDELRRRRQVVRRIDVLRERLFATYGKMPDSVELVRADRER